MRYRPVTGMTCFVALCGVLAASATVPAGEPAEEAAGWKSWTPDHGVAPRFSYRPGGGPDGRGGLVIEAEPDSGLPGYWVKRFPVQGGEHYRFSAYRKVRSVEHPTRCVMMEISWEQEDGSQVPIDRSRVINAERMNVDGDMARPIIAPDHGTDGDSWTRVGATYRAPEGAAVAKVELQMRWAPGGSVEWGGVSVERTRTPVPRRARLAAVHHKPDGDSPQANREQFAPLIEEAAEQRADLVVLGECLTLPGTGRSFAEVAEPIPGPSTRYFGELAKEHDLYIVAGLVERDGSATHNTAALLGPDGQLVGTYRKVTLPRGEIDAGLIPGTEYPVFETRFGRLGIMICWDVHFPEVARNLANNGAEIIAMPIWGGSPDLAAARAIENQLCLVSATYTDHGRDWMKSAIWGYDGGRLATADDWGEVVVAEINLDERRHWWWIGDLKSRIPREKPVGVGE